MNAGNAPEAGGAKTMRRFCEFLRAALLCSMLIVLTAGGLAFIAHAAAQPPWSPAEVSVFEDKGVYRFANDYGIPFYTNDRDTPFQGGGGKVGCGDVCTGDGWLPVFSRASAKPQGDWTIVIRPDQTTQWAYKGKPIYNYFASTDIKEVLAIAGHDPHWHALVP
jgi:predicted lipoprotein with Yx(FWY)xxD motif